MTVHEGDCLAAIEEASNAEMTAYLVWRENRTAENEAAHDAAVDHLIAMRSATR